MPDDLRIALVEDDTRFRQSLQLLIDASPGFNCVGAWQTVEITLRAPELGTADVVLLDLHLPGMDGDEGVELILDRYPGLLVLMFTAYGDEERVFNSLCRGAYGYLLKSTAPGSAARSSPRGSGRGLSHVTIHRPKGRWTTAPLRPRRP